MQRVRDELHERWRLLCIGEEPRKNLAIWNYTEIISRWRGRLDEDYNEVFSTYLQWNRMSVPLCVPRENTARRDKIFASQGRVSSGFFSDKSWQLMSRYIQRASNTNLLLTRWTGTRPALAAATIWSTRGFSRSSSGGRICLVAARVRKALTSENWEQIGLFPLYNTRNTYVKQSSIRIWRPGFHS